LLREEKRREILDTPNYSDFGKPPALFDPFTFDLAAAQQRLAEALASSKSVRTGAKGFNIAFGAENETKDALIVSTRDSSRKGRRLLKLPGMI